MLKKSAEGHGGLPENCVTEEMQTVREAGDKGGVWHRQMARTRIIFTTSPL